jgi:hypothetical protein
MPKQKNCKICLIEFNSQYGRAYCDDCKSHSQKCPHGTKKGRCKIDGCFGQEICIHKQHKQKCKYCKPNMYIADKLNSSIRSLCKGKNIQQKTKEFILQYTSAPSLEILKEHLLNNIDINLSIEYCHLDHIIPKKNFNLANIDELLECCHYTNLQFIHETLNLSKGSKIL